MIIVGTISSPLTLCLSDSMNCFQYVDLGPKLGSVNRALNHEVNDVITDTVEIWRGTREVGRSSRDPHLCLGSRRFGPLTGFRLNRSVRLSRPGGLCPLPFQGDLTTFSTVGRQGGDGRGDPRYRGELPPPSTVRDGGKGGRTNDGGVVLFGSQIQYSPSEITVASSVSRSVQVCCDEVPRSVPSLGSPGSRRSGVPGVREGGRTWKGVEKVVGFL